MTKTSWTFDRGIGRLDLEREFDTDLLKLHLSHRLLEKVLHIGVRLNRKEAREIADALYAFARTKGCET